MSPSIDHPLSIPGPRRPGFMIVETIIALGILVTVMMVIAQLSVWSMTERTRTAARLEAVEAAANVLESARALPYDSLTQEWGDQQKLPDAVAQRWSGGQLKVQVQPEKDRPSTRRVTVEVRWEESPGNFIRPVKLVGLVSDRRGGKP